jgi:hypothetical protein
VYTSKEDKFQLLDKAIQFHDGNSIIAVSIVCLGLSLFLELVSSETYLKEFWFKTWVTFNVILQFQMNFYMLLDFWPVVNGEDLITYNKPIPKKDSTLNKQYLLQ